VPDFSGACELDGAPPRPPDGDSPLQQRFRAIQEAEQENQALVRRLAASGVQVDPLAGLNIQLSMLMDFLFPPANPQSAQIRLMLAEKSVATFRELLEKIQAESVQAQLAAGARVPPDMLRAMAKQQGLTIPAAEQNRR